MGVIANLVQAHGDRVEELTPVIRVIGHEAAVGIALALRQVKNRVGAQRSHPGDRAVLLGRGNEPLIDRVVAASEVRRQVAMSNQLLLARDVPIAVEEVQHRRRNQHFHFGARLHTPQLGDLHLGADESADERVGEVDIGIRVLLDTELLLHVQELVALPETALARLGVQCQHAAKLRRVAADEQAVAADGPGDLLAVLEFARSGFGTDAPGEPEQAEHSLR